MSKYWGIDTEACQHSEIDESLKKEKNSTDKENYMVSLEIISCQGHAAI